MARYRNRMVHFYDDVTPPELYGILTKERQDVEEILTAIQRWLAIPPRPATPSCRASGPRRHSAHPSAPSAPSAKPGFPAQKLDFLSRGGVTSVRDCMNSGPELLLQVKISLHRRWSGFLSGIPASGGEHRSGESRASVRVRHGIPGSRRISSRQVDQVSEGQPGSPARGLSFPEAERRFPGPGCGLDGPSPGCLFYGRDGTPLTVRAVSPFLPVTSTSILVQAAGGAVSLG